MSTAFLISILLMAAHKVECWLQAEWRSSPFFLWLTRKAARHDLGEAVFLTFVVWLFAGLAMGWLVLTSPLAGIVALGCWGLTYVLEWHHVLRTIAARRYYVGTGTALAHLAFGPVYWYTLVHHALAVLAR